MSKANQPSQGFDIRFNEAQLKETLDYFKSVGGKTNDVIRVAINKSGPRVRTLASQTIRSEVRLKAKYVNDRLKFVRATNRKLTGKITVPARGRLLSLFSTDAMVANDTISWVKPPPVPARGIRVRVKPKGKIHTFMGDNETVGKPFYLVLKNSRRLGIAARRKTDGPKGGKLKVFYGPSLSQAFNTLLPSFIPQAEERFTKEMEDAVRYLLTKMQAPKEDVI